MSGSAERPLHERVSAALDAAGDRTGQELITFIAESFSHDQELVDEIRQLIGVGAQPDHMLDSSPIAAAVGVVRQSAERIASAVASGTTAGFGSMNAPGSRGHALPASLGRYRVLRVVGEGGMGVVYEAEQASPRRRVALKVVRPGAASRSSIARFQHEAQILGQLRHPGIAQIYEAGTDAQSGEAFFAMEFVEGRPLATFAEERAMSTDARIELIARVCDAVQHAHSKGVIHRDLKPGNILVEIDPADPKLGAPKILDFGVAKLTAPDAAPMTLAADAGRIVGTLGYMSPEQISASADDIDTRADVYAIGVMLFELLAGRPPLDVRGTSIAEAARRIAEVDPPPLSTIKPNLRGDLEVITAKALSKDRDRRYASVAELSADLRRFLTHQPISARPPGTMYVLGKFAKRNRGLTSAAVAAVICLAAGLVVSLWQYRGAEAARQRAEAANALTNAVKDYLVEDMITAAVPAGLGHDAKVLDVVNRAAERVGDRFAGQPEIEAEIRSELAWVYSELGKFAQAEEQATLSIRLFVDRLGPEDPRTIGAKVTMVISLAQAGHAERALAMINEITPVLRRVLPEDHLHRLRVAGTEANQLQKLGKLDEAEKIVTRALPIAERALGMSHPTTSALRSVFLAVLSRSARHAEALPLHRAELARYESEFGPAAQSSLAARNNLINGLIAMKQYDEAAELAEDLPALAEKAFAPGHVLRVITNLNATNAMNFAGRLDKADAFGRAALKAADEAFKDEPRWETERIIAQLASIATKRGHTEDSLEFTLRAVCYRAMLAGAGELESVVKAIQAAANRRRAVGVAVENAALVRESAERFDATMPRHAARKSRVLGNLARAAVQLGDLPLAEQLLIEAESIVSAPPEGDVAAAIIAAARSELQAKTGPAR